MFSLMQDPEHNRAKTDQDINNLCDEVARVREQTKKIYETLEMTPLELKELLSNLTPEQQEAHRKLIEKHTQKLEKSRKNLKNPKKDKSKYRLLGMLPSYALHVK